MAAPLSPRTDAIVRLIREYDRSCKAFNDLATQTRRLAATLGKDNPLFFHNANFLTLCGRAVKAQEKWMAIELELIAKYRAYAQSGGEPRRLALAAFPNSIKDQNSLLKIFQRSLGANNGAPAQ